MTKQEFHFISLRSEARILQLLFEIPLHFSELQRQLGISTATLTRHLKTLEKEGLVFRKIEGRKIVFEVNRSKTILQLRKEFLNQFVNLLSIYSSAFNGKTSNLTQDYLNVIKESIEKPEKEAEKSKVFTRTIDSRESVKIPISKPYEPIVFGKPQNKKPKKRKKKLRNVLVRKRDLTISGLKLKRGEKQ